MMRRLPVTVLVCLFALRAATALAQTAAPGPPTTDTRVDEARARFGQGMALADAGNCAGAVAEFEASYALAPRPNTVFNIARCQETLFRYDLAVEAYERFLRDAPPDDPDRAAVQATMASLRNLLGTITVRSNVEAEVWVGERLAGHAPGDVLIPGGRHVLEVRRDGYIPVRREVEIAGRQRVSVDVVLEQAQNITHETTEVTNVTEVTRVEKAGLSPIYFWSGVCVTAVALGVGATLGVQALQLRDRDDARDPRLPTEEPKSNIDDAALRADVFFGSAFALGVGTVIVGWLTDWRGELPTDPPTSGSTRIVPVLSPNNASLSITAVF